MTTFKFPKFKDEPVGYWTEEHIRGLLTWAREDLRASDCCIIAGQPIWLSINGDWGAVSKKPIQSSVVVQT